MGVWLDGYQRVGSYRGGRWSDDDEMKVVLHSVEGGINGAKAVFADGSRPHLLVSPPSRPDGPARLQYISLDESAFALRNTPGGVETNTDGAVQVEIAGFADRMHLLSDSDLEWLGREVIAPIRAAVPGITLDHPRFYGPDAGFTLASPNARQRMSGPAWDRFHGICGHQHVPENDHWDPGGIDIDRILAAAGGTTIPDFAPALENSMLVYGTTNTGGKPRNLLVLPAGGTVDVGDNPPPFVGSILGNEKRRAGKGITNQIANAAEQALER